MQKNIKNLAIIFLVLIIIYLFNNYRETVLPKPSPYLTRIGNLKKESINSFTLSKDKNNLQIIKNNGVWKAEMKKADGVKIDSFLLPLFPKAEPEAVSESSSKQKDFLLTKELATEVKLTDKLSLLLGKTSSNGLYVRFPDNNTVFILKGMSETLFSTTPTFWRDKTIVSFNKDKASKLFLDKNGTKIILVNKNKKWVFEDTGKEPDKTKTEALFSAISPLTALDFATKEKAASYPETPELTLSLEQEKTKENLEFYKGENDYLVKRASDGELFTISSSTIDPLLKFSE